MNEGHTFTISHNGTQFTVNLKSSKEAKESFEYLICREIEKKAMMLVSGKST